jgi:hypothetical protein
MTDAMTIEKIYLNENLSLRDLALHLKADPNLISYILNSQLNKNFHDFVNHHRAPTGRECKNLLMGYYIEGEIDILGRCNKIVHQLYRYRTFS